LTEGFLMISIGDLNNHFFLYSKRKKCYH